MKTSLDDAEEVPDKGSKDIFDDVGGEIPHKKTMKASKMMMVKQS